MMPSPVCSWSSPSAMSSATWRPLHAQHAQQGGAGEGRPFRTPARLPARRQAAPAAPSAWAAQRWAMRVTQSCPGPAAPYSPA